MLTGHSTMWLNHIQAGRKPGRVKMNAIAVNSIKHGREAYLQEYGCDWLSYVRTDESNSAKQQVLVQYDALSCQQMTTGPGGCLKSF